MILVEVVKKFLVVWVDAFGRSRSVCSIRGEPLRLETEALLCPVDHGPCRADLGLANGAGCFDVNDDAALHVDKVVVGVSEECRPPAVLSVHRLRPIVLDRDDVGSREVPETSLLLRPGLAIAGAPPLIPA